MSARFLFFALLFLTLLAGCGRDNLQGRCSTDGDCSAGQACVGGLCAPDGEVDLGTDSGCDPGVNCSAACTTDADCGADEACNVNLGLCVSTECFEAENTCVTNMCDEGGCSRALCDLGCGPMTIQSGCECIGATCDSNADCDAGVCVEGACVPCSDSSQCDAGLVCTEGECVEDTRCMGDEDCAANERCTEDGVCLPRPECVLDTDCRDNEICLNGRCSFSPECTDDFDCPEGFECVGDRCFEILCRGPEDCGPGEVCDAGECVIPNDPSTCFVATSDQIIVDNQSVLLEAFAFDDMGNAIAGTFVWQSSNNNVASVDDQFARGEAAAGDATFTAQANIPSTGETIQCTDSAVLTNPGPVNPNDLRVVVFDQESNAPLAGARVVVDGVWVGVTFSNGLITTPIPAGAFEVSVFHDDFDYMSFLNVTENEIRVPLKRKSGSGPAAGFTGDFDMSMVHSTGNINIGLAGASLRGGLLDVNLLGILGDNFVTDVSLPGLGDFSVPLPGGLVAYGVGLPIKQGYYARTTGGPRFAWGLAGKVPIFELINLFMGGGLNGEDVLGTLLPLFNRFDHEAFPQILTELPQVVDSGDLDGDGDTTELLPNYAQFPTIDLAPNVRQNLATDVGVSNFPFLSTGQAGIAILVGGTSLESTGFVPLGISATTDDDGDGRPDTRRLTMAPNHGPLAGGRYAVIALAFDGGGLGGGQFGLPDEFSAALYNGQNFPANIGLGTFPDSSVGTAANNRVVAFSTDAGPLYRVRIVGPDRSWEVWDTGGPDVQGQFNHNLVVPDPPQGVVDIYPTGSVFLDAIQTNVELNDIVGGTGIGLTKAGFVASSFNRTRIR